MDITDGEKILTRESWQKYMNRGGLVFVIGAGVSVASGLPVFRTTDPPVLKDERGKEIMTCADAFDFIMCWKEYLYNPWGDMEARKRLLGHYKVIAHLFLLADSAEPTNFHRLLADLFTRKKIRKGGIMTSNIDGLEEKAGIPGDNVIQLHGTVRTLRCLHCGHTIPMTRALAEALLACPYDTVPMDVIPVHWDCRVLRVDARNPPAVERVLYRPFVQLYGNDPWGDLFQKPTLNTVGYTLVVVGSSLRGDKLKATVRSLAKHSKALLVVDPKIPSALNGFNPYFLQGPAERAATYSLPEHPPIQPVVSVYSPPCVPRTSPANPVPFPGPSRKRLSKKPTKGPAEDDLPGPSRAPTHSNPQEAEKLLPFPQAFLPHAAWDELNDPWKALGHKSINRADFIKSIRDAQNAVAPTSGPSRQPRGKSSRVNPYPKVTPPRYSLPSEQVLPNLWDLPIRRRSAIGLSGEISEEDIEQQDGDDQME
jgi:NAD-dependent SIR2 family protein deacetylase